MNRPSRNMILCASIIAAIALPELSYGRGGAGADAAAAVGASAAGVRAGLSAVATKAQATNVAADDAAAAGQAGAEAQVAAQKPAAPADPCAVPTLMDGWYMGVQLGYGSYRMRNSILTPGPTGLTSNLVTANSNWAAGILAGYGKMANDWFYIGGEIFIDANNFESNTSYTLIPPTLKYVNQVNAGPTYGLSLLPGIRLTPSTLTFARLGWNRVTAKTDETITSTPSTPSSSTSKTINGLVIGIGIETLITSNYSVRGEFDHMVFNSYNTKGIYNTLVNTSSNQFMLSFIYHTY